jgi:prolyl 4-hydroxylase
MIQYIIFFILILILIFIYYNKSYKVNNDVVNNDEIINYMKFTNILNKLKSNNVEDEFIERFNCEYFNKITNKKYNFIMNSLDNVPINIINNFVSDLECNQLINYAKNRFKNSTVGYKVHTKDKSIRDSKTAIFDKSENYLISCIESRIAKLLNVKKSSIENLQLTSYDREQFYSYHYDLVPNLKNQRKYSIIIYLNTLNEGKTDFPYYNYKSYPEKGKLLYFTNLFDDNSENILTLHQSEKIINNKTKYVLVSWITL